MRLVEVRKRQRDEVGVAVLKARHERDEQDLRLAQAKQELENEARASAVRPLEPFDPELRRLQVDCLIAAQAEAVVKQEALRQAETQLRDETKRLFAAHTKVRQMELLSEAQAKAEATQAEKAEQKASDDLSLIKEADK